MSIDSFRKQQIKKFEADFKKYDVPFGFRMYGGIDLYTNAEDELYLLKKGMITLDDVYNDPDSILRNIMKLWPIDKKKLKKR